MTTDTTEPQAAFTLKMVPWYGWVALVIVAHALYYRNHLVAISAIAGYLVAKRMMGRV